MIKTAIFDIDDTLISSSEYTSNSGLAINMDIQNRKVIDLLQQLKDRNFYIVIMTNRNENTFRTTKKSWIYKWNFRKGNSSSAGCEVLLGFYSFYHRKRFCVEKRILTQSYPF